MSISSEITRIQNKRDQSFTEVANKGVTVPAGSTIDDLPGLIAQIEQGSDSGSGGIIYQDLDGYLNLSEDEANVISIVDTLDTAGGTVRTITGAVESGNKGSINELISGAWPNGNIIYDLTDDPIDQALAYRKSIGSLTITKATRLSNYFAQYSSVTSVIAPLVTTAKWYGFTNCTSLTSISFPKLTAIPRSLFEACRMTNIAFPSLTGNVDAYSFRSNPMLSSVDFANVNSIATQVFEDDTLLDKLILRRSDKLVVLNNIACFNRTPFASGGAGGTIYIPKSLYDHLGDGTSLDYKAATNWSTIDGYGTITWAQIEGSIYETQYADGTPIT